VSHPEELTDVNGTLFFSAGSALGVELWKSDGTPGGTTMVNDIYPGEGHSYPAYLTNVNGTLLFIATDDISPGLWKSDGTAAGTTLVKHFPGRPIEELTNVNGTLFFQAFDQAAGVELWSSDGTTVGTALVRDIRSGAGSSYPFYLTNVNGTLYFTADDGILGNELWKAFDPTTASGVTLSLAGSPLAEAAGSATITATLPSVSAQNVTVNLSFSGTAANVSDYTFSSNSIQIPTGSISGSITLTTVQDTLEEPTETIIIQIASVTNANEAGEQEVTATIIDDDAPPEVSLSLLGEVQTEGLAGIATVTATLSKLATQQVIVELDFPDLGAGFATYPADYSRSGTSIVIPAGSLEPIPKRLRRGT
jgi:ELWxxDGT repeat protein